MTDVVVTVFHRNNHGHPADQGAYIDWPPPEADRALQWFQQKLDQIPEEHRSTAQVQIESSHHKDGTAAYISIWYTRPQTKEEAEYEHQEAARRVEYKEQQERKMLEALKLKYDPQLEESNE